MLIGKQEFDFNHNIYIMGILNFTPDSFSDGGKFNTIDKALTHVEDMIREGADIIDLGGESTRPGHQFVPAQEEIERISPIIEKIKQNFDIPLSLDTYKGEVAQAGIALGVDLINDIWGLKYDEHMAKVIAQAGIPCCLMHNRDNTTYDNFIEDVLGEMMESVEIARAEGIKDEQIILDPGIGFGKTYEQNLIMLNHLEKVNSLGFPVLLGTSRKSVIGLTLDVPVDERVEGTIATSVLATLNNYAFVRVHDVQANKRAIQMIQAIKHSGGR